jgi:hypothetical protein
MNCLARNQQRTRTRRNPLVSIPYSFLRHTESYSEHLPRLASISRYPCSRACAT